MKFDEAIALADGNLLNEEVLNEILYNKYANALLTKKESVIRDQNRKIIEAEGKPNKMRSFPHGEKTADKSVTMPDAGGLIQFSEGVMNYLKSHYTEDDIKKLLPYFNLAIQDLKEKISKVEPIEDDKEIKK
jgi:hypothetical protein